MDAVAVSVKQLITVRPLKFRLPFPSKASSNNHDREQFETLILLRNLLRLKGICKYQTGLYS